VTVPVDPPPITIPPPRLVALAGLLVLVEAFGVLVLAGFTVVSGLAADAPFGQVAAQGMYYLVIAALIAACGTAVLRGRRWGRTPSLLTQIVMIAIGIWLIAPSGQLIWGILLILMGGFTGGLLVSRPANAWINQFPAPFAPEPDH
jgi:hypothetical protein